MSLQTVKGTVNRAFYFQGKVLEKGATCELPRPFALEMQAAKKFSISAETAPVSEAAPEVKPVAKPVKRGEK